MERIIRIQHKTLEYLGDIKEGIYTASYFFKNIYGELFGVYNGVRPTRDSLLIKNLGSADIANYVFGFDSIVQLRNWFYNDEFLKLVNDEGFECVWIQGEVVKGHTQAIVKIQGAVVVKKESILDIIKGCEN